MEKYKKLRAGYGYITDSSSNSAYNDWLEKVIAGWAAATLFFTSVSFAFVIHIQLIISIGMILVLLDTVVKRRIYCNYSASVITLTTAFVLVIAIGVTSSRAPVYGMEKFTVLTGWVLYFLLIAGYIRNHIQYFLKINIWLSIIYCVVMAYSFGDPITLLRSAVGQDQRLGLNHEEGGEVFNPIWLSRYLCYCLLSYVLLGQQLRQRMIYSVVCLLLVMYLVATASKGPLLALLISSMVYLKAMGRISPKVFWGTVLLFAVVLIGGSTLLETGGNEYLAARFSLLGSSGEDRMGMIGKLSEQILFYGNIFWGEGTGTAGYVLNGRDTRGYPHNILVEVFYENGILGLFILLVLLTNAFMMRRRRNEQYCIAAFHLFLFFFINALLSGDIEFNQYVFLFYFVFMIRPQPVVL